MSQEEAVDSTSAVHPEPSDQELVRRAQGGDQQAMTILYGRFRRKVLNYLYRFTGNRGTAEELTQETFLRVVQHIKSYRPTGSVAGWIYRIAGNLAMNLLRNRPTTREVSLDEPLIIEDDTVDRAQAIAGSTPRPDEAAVRNENEQAVQRSLLKISPHHRAVVILCDVEGYSYREASQFLGCPVNTIASRLARARAELAQLLGFLKKENGS